MGNNKRVYRGGYDLGVWCIALLDGYRILALRRSFWICMRGLESTASQQERMNEKRGPERPLKDITPFWIKCSFISSSAFSPPERKFPLVTFFSCCHMTSSHSGKSSLVSLRPMIHHLNALHQLRSATTSSLLPSRESVSPADTPNKRRHSDRLPGFSAFGHC